MTKLYTSARKCDAWRGVVMHLLSAVTKRSELTVAQIDAYYSDSVVGKRTT